MASDNIFGECSKGWRYLIPTDDPKEKDINDELMEKVRVQNIGSIHVKLIEILINLYDSAEDKHKDMIMSYIVHLLPI